MAGKNVKEIKLEFLKCEDGKIFDALISRYEKDERKSVRNLVAGFQRAHEKMSSEKARVEGLCEYEKKYSGIDFVCGIDEAGRGPLAGPVVAAAVILPKDCRILYINDSKKLSSKRRDMLFDEIKEKAVSYGVGIVGHEVIDKINILQATYLAMRTALNDLKVKPGVLLNDAVIIPGVDISQVPIIRGDLKSQSIAAASIIAKVTRDRLMEKYDSRFPLYGFASHKGYGTAEHIAAIKKYGLCEIHRRSFTGHFC